MHTKVQQMKGMTNMSDRWYKWGCNKTWTKHSINACNIWTIKMAIIYLNQRSSITF